MCSFPVSSSLILALDYGGINTAYLGFWGTKIKFHQENPEVPGDLSPTKFNASNYHTSELYVFYLFCGFSALEDLPFLG